MYITVIQTKKIHEPGIIRT